MSQFKIKHSHQHMMQDLQTSHQPLTLPPIHPLPPSPELAGAAESKASEPSSVEVASVEKIMWSLQQLFIKGAHNILPKCFRRWTSYSFKIALIEAIGSVRARNGRYI